MGRNQKGVPTYKPPEDMYDDILDLKKVGCVFYIFFLIVFYISKVMVLLKPAKCSSWLQISTETSQPGCKCNHIHSLFNCWWGLQTVIVKQLKLVPKRGAFSCYLS